MSSDVGYAQNGLRFGSTGVIAQFVGIGGTNGEIDIQDIKCNDGCSDIVTIEILDYQGLTDETYNWIDWYENAETGETEACWTDSYYEKLVDFKIQPGQGMWVYGDSEDQYITIPGVEL